MSFELLPGLAPWLYGFIAVSLLLSLASIATLSIALLDNRRIRITRRERVSTYYGRMVFSH